MYIHNLYSLKDENVEEIIRNVSALKEKYGYREVCNYLLNKMPLKCYMANPDDYYERIAKYNLAMLLAGKGDFDGASEIYQDLGLRSAGDLPALTFFDHCRKAKALREQQLDAIAREIPAIYLVAQPKSASASLSNSIAKILDIPILRVFGDGVIEYWLESFLEGGATTHEHTVANDYNLMTLESAGVTQLFVQIRDPRDSAMSILKMYKAQKSATTEFPSYEKYKEYFAQHLSFINDWASYYESENRQIEIHWVKFDELKKDMFNTIKGILQRSFGESYGISDSWDSRIQSGMVECNRSTSNSSWRTYLSDRQKMEIFEMIPESVRLLLDIKCAQ